MSVARFAEFEFDARTRRLTHASNDVALGSRALDLLELLIASRNRVVTRSEIMETVWPSTVVGDNNLNVQVANLRRVLGSDAIVTVPGRGLRFGLEVLPEEPLLQLPDRPSVVVLPFARLGGDPDLDWIADGFVEDITTELSRFRDLFVVARNSAFAYRRTPRDLRRIARDLGVRYVVEGSVRAGAGQVRVTAQLIDAGLGGQVWAENFDGEIAGHFETQTRVASAIVACLMPQIDQAERARVGALPPDDLTAYGLAQRGWGIISSAEMTYEPEPRNRAEAFARRALDHDPGSGLAWRVLAWVHWWNAYHATTTSIPATLADGIDAASRAIAIDPTDHHAHRLRALLRFMDHDAEAGLPELRLAHELNPNCAITLAWLGLYETMAGDASQGIPLAEAALRRSPRDPARGSMLAALGFAQFNARDYGAAAATAEAALVESAASATPLILGTIALVGAGRLDRAAAMFRRAEAMAPNLVQARLAGRWLAANPDYLARAHMFFRIAAGQAPAEAADALR